MRELLGGGAAALADVWRSAVDLVLPAACVGCGATDCGGVLCPRCAAALRAAAPRPVRPDPAPPGLPACTALDTYAGPLRATILGYKERGRHTVAAALGDRLADVVAAAAQPRVGVRPNAAVPARVPVVLVPVPSSAAAARRRYGDHMWRLARRARRRLRGQGWAVAVARPVKARAVADSVALSSEQRAERALAMFTPVPRRLAAVSSAAAAGAAVVLVDDVLTTGATLAAVASRLRAAGVPVHSAAVLAATRRRRGSLTDVSTRRSIFGDRTAT